MEQDNQLIDVVENVQFIDNTEQLNKLIEQNNKIIEQYDTIIDYFVPTPQEIEEHKKEQQQLELQEKKEFQEQEEQKQKNIDDITSYLSEKDLQQEEYQTRILHELGLLNDNISNVGINTEYSNNYSYLLLLLLLLTGVCYFIYKIIRKFIY